MLLSFLFLCSALSAGGNRVLNANDRAIRRSDMIQRANFRASGVRWKYRRNSTAERLSASGTLTEAADVEVLVGRKGNMCDSPMSTWCIALPPSRSPPLSPPPLIATEATPTTRPISTVTGMFSATNQSSGKQWVDHCVYGCVMWCAHTLTALNVCLHCMAQYLCVVASLNIINNLYMLTLALSITCICAYRLPFCCYHPCGSTQCGDQGNSIQCQQLFW